MKCPTTYIEFTASGGRIGRLEWWNGDDQFWGHIGWDRHWPNARPVPNGWWARLQDSIEKVVGGFASIGHAMATVQATIEAFGVQITGKPQSSTRHGP